MKKRTKLLTIGLCALLLLSLCLPVAASGLLPGLKIFSNEETVSIPKSEYERLKQYERLDQVLEIVEKYYIDEPDADKLIQSAIDGLLYALDDPYTRYLPPETMEKQNEERRGTYSGVGMQLMVSGVDSPITVTRVFKGSPADKAGVLRGDKVVAVNGVEYYGTGMSDAVSFLRGEIGTDVTVTYVRDGVAEPFDLVLTRGMVEIDNVAYEMLDGDIGYLLLYEFTGTDVRRFYNALDFFVENNAKGLILDLRDNPGGFVDDAINIADAFLPEGLVMYTEDRYGNRDSKYSDADLLGLPMVVLVNEYSASASEILTGAIKDYGAGKIVGVKTFGKGIVQTLMPFQSDGAGLMLTTMRYYTPSGVCIHKTGIEPDVLVEQPEDLRVLGNDVPHDQDVQLKKAIEVLQEEMAGPPPQPKAPQ